MDIFWGVEKNKSMDFRWQYEVWCQSIKSGTRKSLSEGCEVSQSCLTLYDPVDCSLPGSSIHGIFQARVLEWVAISFSRGSSQPRGWTWISCIAGRCFTIWARSEASEGYERENGKAVRVLKLGKIAKVTNLGYRVELCILRDVVGQGTSVNDKRWARQKASLIAQLVKNLPAMQETLVQFLGQEDPLEKNRLPNPVFLGFPCGSAGKESTCNVGDLGSIPGLGRSSGEGKGYPLQYSGLENPMDRIVHWVKNSWTQLIDFHFHFQATGGNKVGIQLLFSC